MPSVDSQGNRHLRASGSSRAIQSAPAEHCTTALSRSAASPSPGEASTRYPFSRNCMSVSMSIPAQSSRRPCLKKCTPYMDSSTLARSENCCRMPPAERGAEARSYVGSPSKTAMRSSGAAAARCSATEDPTTPPPTIATSHFVRLRPGTCAKAIPALAAGALPIAVLHGQDSSRTAQDVGPHIAGGGCASPGAMIVVETVAS
mmetsp:Transcript_12422/g.34201  ORF Transcript_12422/g.34201 Transcript_12422/m.34201 type:complete len:203 (-) Transcript_12422:20-628(-)